MRLIKVHDEPNFKIYINPRFVNSIELKHDYYHGITYYQVYMNDGKETSVLETKAMQALAAYFDLS